MHLMHIPSRLPELLLGASLIVGACAPAGPPPINEMAGDVGRLEAVLPLVEELRATDFEDSPYCQNLAYARGSFGDMTQDGCARTGTGAFDAVAREDHARLAAALDAAVEAADWIRTATYTADGDLATAWFALTDASITENGDYLYDPTGAEPKQDIPDRQTFTRINDAWWFVWSFDD